MRIPTSTTTVAARTSMTRKNVGSRSAEAEPPVVGGLMPGEQQGTGARGMPGEGGGLMPGEAGGMPGA